MVKRRDFIRSSVLASAASLIGFKIAHAAKMPYGYVPVLSQQDIPFSKHQDMVVLNDRPWNIEAMAHLLDDRVTPENKMFVRNNGIIPKNMDVNTWELLIDGESALAQKKYTLDDLQSKFKSYTYQLTLECGGNGRSEFNPPAKGNQWTVGAVSCAEWTGVRLKDVLNDVGIKDSAIYVGYYGSDTHLSGDSSKDAISRGIPLSKAMMEETLLAYKMNGEDIPLAHGFPVRLVAGGWPASASGKWINRLSIRNKIHDGEKMGGSSYRIPCESVAPGTEVNDGDMCIIESMPVKSLITYPKSGALVRRNQKFEVRGHAWAGEKEVRTVDYSVNFGATWQACTLEKPKNRLAWQHWKTTVSLSKTGYYELWVRATDDQGMMQPMVVPGWNPKGYLNNACHRIAIKSV
ncbi:MAG: sulfite oxidase [Bacteroidota bacterium]